MDGFFRAVAIGLGVLLGTLNPGTEPELQVAVTKAEQLLVSGTLLRGTSKAMLEALDEGVVMTLTLQASIDGRAAPAAVHTLALQPLTKEWAVTVAGEPRRLFAARDAAASVWLQWKDIPAGPLPAGPFTVTVSVELSFPGRPDWKSDLVWKSSPTWTRSYTRLSEVPY